MHVAGRSQLVSLVSIFEQSAEKPDSKNNPVSARALHFLLSEIVAINDQILVLERAAVKVCINYHRTVLDGCSEGRFFWEILMPHEARCFGNVTFGAGS